MILAADIGGTKALFALYDAGVGFLKPVYIRRYPSKDFNSPESAIRTFLSDYKYENDGEPVIESACLAMAATITEEHLFMSNLSWQTEIKNLKQNFPKIRIMKLCNDLEATGYGLGLLNNDDLYRLNPGENNTTSDIITSDIQSKTIQSEKESRRAIIAPGTGLGEAFLLGSKVIASEGGHCEFGPRSEAEVGLWRFLHERYGHVSYERILSGPGLSQLESFVRNNGIVRSKEASKIGADNIGTGDIAAGGIATGDIAASNSMRLPEDITRLALSEQCPVCMQALDHFVNILGAEAGNLALKFLAVDGIYLAGGIPPKILSKLKDNTFLHSFYMKGRFSDMMKSIPVFVVLNPNTALYGAASLAAKSVYPEIEFSIEY